MRVVKNEGITLIALVITIIVLLILAGVSIATLTGENGVLTQAENAKVETEEAEIEEQRKLAQAEARTHLENYIYTDTSTEPEETAVIPAGFAVSPIEGENSIDTGLVVIGEDGSEFVWVPVGDINDMAQCSIAGGDCNLEPDSDGHLYCETHSNSTEIVGKLYARSTEENFGTVNTSYSPDSGLREPAIIVDYDNNTSYNDGLFTLASLKSDYKLMAESVEKYGGFYVGRYETSLSTATAEEAGASGTAQSKAGVIPTTSNNSATYRWYGLYSIQKNYTASEDSVQSSMIWGSQYDAMLNWALDGNDSSKVTTQGIGGNNSSGTVTITGNNTYSSDSINNIRDLGGNLYEWTLEAYSTHRVLRGGYYKYASSASFRINDVSTHDNIDGGSRLTLYIK